MCSLEQLLEILIGLRFDVLHCACLRDKLREYLAQLFVDPLYIFACLGLDSLVLVVL